MNTTTADTKKGILALLSSLVLAACGGGGSGGAGGGNNGGASAGFVVAARANPAEINIYRVDQPNVPIGTIAGARFTQSLGTPRIGTAWGVPAGGKYSRIGIFTSSTPLVLGEEAGHTYDFIDLIPSAVARLAWVDCATPTSCGVTSSLLDGTDMRTLHSGCTDIVVNAAKVGEAGVAFRCAMPGPVNEWWFSDGVAAAFKLAAPAPGDDARSLQALTAGRAIFRHPVERHLVTQPLAAASTESNLVEPDQMRIEHDLLSLNGRTSFGGRLLVRRTDVNVTGVGRYELRTMNDDGTDQDIEIASAGVPFLLDVSPDGARFLALIIDKDGAGTNDEIWGFAFSIDPTGDVVAFTEGNVATAGSNGLDARFTADGKVAINHENGWHLFEPTGALIPGANVTPDPRYSWAGTKGSWFYVYAPLGTPQNFIAAKSDGTLADISLNAPNPLPVHRADGVLLFVDGNGDAWLSVYNPTSGLFEASPIEAIDALRVDEAGEGPGNRVFLTLTLLNGGNVDQDVVMFDLDDRTTTPLVSGATSDTGFFFPN
ncbi:MAG: hypothetical protein WBO23_04880 [Burkholderiales bacterium]